MRKFVVIGAVVGVLALTGGCAPADGGTVTSGASRTDKATDAAAKKKVPTFKQAITYKDGLKVQVTKLVQKKVSGTASGAKPGSSMTLFTIKITNGTKEPYDATLLSPVVSYGAEGDEAAQVFDSESGADGGMTGKVLPGKAKSAPYAFAIPAKELKDVTLEVRLGLDFDHDSAIFSGSAK